MNRKCDAFVFRIRASLLATPRHYRQPDATRASAQVRSVGVHIAFTERKLDRFANIGVVSSPTWNSTLPSIGCHL
jgi:hypothetical protein